jgi:hypothetical protein
MCTAGGQEKERRQLTESLGWIPEFVEAQDISAGLFGEAFQARDDQLEEALAHKEIADSSVYV